MNGGLPESVTSVGTQIGRYFSLTSLLPSLLFLAWVIALNGAAKPLGEFDFDGAEEALTEWSLTKLGLVLASALLLGLVVHPLLFATTQILEGYWGPRPFAVRVATALAIRHRRRQDQLEDRAASIGGEIKTALNAMSRAKLGEEAFNKLTSSQQRDQRARRRVSPSGAQVHGLVIAHDSIKKVLANMPKDADRILPTRLGNALRRVEDSAGKQYGLDLVTVAPHITVAAGPETAAYVNDSREQLDVSVRLAFYGFLAALLTTVWMLGAGWWMLIALIPYGFAFVTYCGAVAAAGEWGAAISACVDLDRFAMYDAMHLEPPADTKEERDRNARLVKLIQGDRRLSVTYTQPPSS